MTDEKLEALFKPPPPRTTNAAARGDEWNTNKRLRNDGLLPIKWQSSITRLRMLGIEVEERDGAFVRGIGWRKSWWAPAWAVLLCEAEPLPDEARDWALAEAMKGGEFFKALEVVAALSDRQKVAEFVHEMWEPTP